MSPSRTTYERMRRSARLFCYLLYAQTLALHTVSLELLIADKVMVTPHRATEGRERKQAHALVASKHFPVPWRDFRNVKEARLLQGCKCVAWSITVEEATGSTQGDGGAVVQVSVYGQS